MRKSLVDFGGREVKHTGDGVLAFFPFVSKAIECGIEIQRAFNNDPSTLDGVSIRLRVGISAGEPVAESDDLFGAGGSASEQVVEFLVTLADAGFHPGGNKCVPVLERVNQ